MAMHELTAHFESQVWMFKLHPQP